MDPSPRTITIIGAGFSGTAVALRLLRGSAAGALRVLLVDAAAPGRGLAYARREHPYLLNVPAGRMSACADEPAQFLDFARRHVPGASARDFLPRELYGEYLEATLAVAQRAAGAQVSFEHVRGTVTALQRSQRDRRFRLLLSDGRTLDSDVVVLALGNPPPPPLPVTTRLTRTARCYQDPWASPRAFRANETVLVVGSGLTMADVVLAGMQEAGATTVVHALSRHGLLPLTQTDFESGHTDRDSRPLLRAAAVSARQLVRAVRALAAQITAGGGDWREAITFVRTLAPVLWQRLGPHERRRFLRHARCHWDLHRHRLPQQSAATLDALRADGRLQVHAGRLTTLASQGRRIRVTWTERGTGAPRSLLVDRVINCTGPDYDLRRSRQPLLRSLLSQGVACPDSLGLGLLTDELGTLTSAGGRPATDLYYVGPMLRAAHWETTAVPELREYATRLATHLLQGSPAQAPATGSWQQPPRLHALHA